MGNWRTVWIVGTVSPDEVNPLRDKCFFDVGFGGHGEYHCLSFTIPCSCCGIDDWVAKKMNRVGNLAERDYAVEDVAKKLEELVKVAPSLDIKVHCGGDFEDKKCVATIIVKDGKVTTVKPEVEILPEQSVDDMKGRLFGLMDR